MKFRSEKGYTGVEIAISVIIITIFVSLIAVIISRFNSSANEIRYKEKATTIAIEEIEKIKKDGFEPLIDKGIDSKETIVEEETDRRIL